MLAHLAELVVKEVHGAGGYGMLVGPAASAAERDAFRARIIAQPDKYIAQPTLALSTCPTFVESGLAPRHIDLRPYVLSGKTVNLVPGGLTRVALREGSLVVNSSQGGGTKDTWVMKLGLADRTLQHPTNQNQAMLCRTANELYWMARHIERAENTARLLDVTYRMSLLPYDAVEPGPRLGRAVGGAADHLGPRHRVSTSASRSFRPRTCCAT